VEIHAIRFSEINCTGQGSVIPLFIEQAKTGTITITDERMTRFMITLEQGVELVWHAFDDMEGGEIYVKKIPSMKLTNIALAISEIAKQKIIGIRPGEKLHEQMIGIEDAPFTFEYRDHFKILPQIHDWANDPYRIKGGVPVREGFSYSSDNNMEWMTVASLRKWIKNYEQKNKSINYLRIGL
jgi:FlaA1/EpsC-like NDP-sugar epimerase